MSKKLSDLREVISFGIIGVINTIVGTSVMFLLYNIIGMGYWFSSAANYVVGSIVSFILNKRFTFQVEQKDKMYLIKFIINISLCYLIAYGVAKKAVYYLLQYAGFNSKIMDNISMIVGMGLFVVLNFLGQKLFVFKKKNK